MHVKIKTRYSTKPFEVCDLTPEDLHVDVEITATYSGCGHSITLQADEKIPVQCPKCLEERIRQRST